MLATPWRKLMIEIRFTYERAVVRSSTSEAATWSPSWLPLQTWQLNHCTLGYRTPRDDDSDESVCSLPCGPYQIHPTGKQVCLTDPDQTHSPLTHKHTHTHSNTHFPRPPLCATPLIPIGLSLWLQIFFTCSEIMLKLRGHNKSAQLLVVGSEKPQTAQARIFINMICETFQTTEKSCAACGWRRNHIPLCCVWSFLYCVYNADSRGVCLNASQCAHMHAGSLSEWRGVWKQSWEDGMNTELHP